MLNLLPENHGGQVIALDLMAELGLERGDSDIELSAFLSLCTSAVVEVFRLWCLVGKIMGFSEPQASGEVYTLTTK